MTTHKERKNIKLQNLRGIKEVKNTFGILVILGAMEQRPKVPRDIVLTCMVLHNMLRTYQGEQTVPQFQQMM